MKSLSLSLNTNFMESDAVRSLIEAGKADALVTFLALQTVVRRAGYCVNFDEHLITELRRLTGFDAARVRADISAIVEAGFFDAEIYTKARVLTTRRLQSAYRRRKNAEPIPAYLLCQARSKSRRKAAPTVQLPPLTRAERRRIEREAGRRRRPVYARRELAASEVEAHGVLRKAVLHADGFEKCRQ